MTRIAAPVRPGDHVLGNEDAPVTLIEYADYECPYSGHAYYTIKQVQEDLGDEVRYVFRNFPLTQMHPHALPAALTAEAADNQGRFWEMYDLLFGRQQALEAEHLVAYAQLLDLDIEQFILDMTSDETTERVREDFLSGIQSGVNGTPTFFINASRYDGAYDYQTLSEALKTAVGEDGLKKNVLVRRSARVRM